MALLLSIGYRDDDDWLFFTEHYSDLAIAEARMRYAEQRDKLRTEKHTQWELILSDSEQKVLLEIDSEYDGAFYDDGVHEERTIDHWQFQEDRNNRTYVK
jgi:hypothetical protein